MNGWINHWIVIIVVIWRFLNDNYNPYLSAERQMAELFNDSAEVRRPATGTLPPVDTRFTRSTPAAIQQPEEATSIDKLEEDLKSIFSEISQLGKSNETPTREPAPRASAGGNDAGSIPEVDKQPSKFCHSCGSAYPERYPVKYCCQCGERRLNLWSVFKILSGILWRFFLFVVAVVAVVAVVLGDSWRFFGNHSRLFVILEKDSRGFFERQVDPALILRDHLFLFFQKRERERERGWEGRGGRREG